MGTRTVLLLLLGLQLSVTNGKECLAETYGTQRPDQFKKCVNGVTTLQSCEAGQHYSAAHQACTAAEEKSLPEDVKVLGRLISLGALYDGRTDRFVPSMSLWKKKTIQDHKEVDNRQQEVKTEVRAENSIKERLNHFDIKASISASFLSGLIQVSGSAGYLSDRISVDNEVNVVLKYHTTKFRETLEASTPKDFPEHCTSNAFTHVVTSIVYGIDANFVFKRLTDIQESMSEITGSLSIAIKSVPGLEISGSGSVNIREEDRDILNTTTLKLYGDFSPETKLPSNYIEAASFYKELPKLAGTEEDQYKGSAPLIAMITPLKLICKAADYTLNSVGAGVISKMTDMNDELDKLRQRTNGLLAREPSLRFPSLKRSLDLYGAALETFTLNVDNNLREILPNVRGGTGLGETDLVTLFEEYMASQFEFSVSQRFLSHRARETEAIQILLEKFPRDVSNIAVVDFDSGNDVDYIFNRDQILVMNFNCITPAHNTESFLKGTFVDERNHWYNDITNTAMVGVEIRKFVSFALQNKNKDEFGYLIKINPVQSKPLSLTAIVSGSRVDDFIIPEEPVAKYEGSPTRNMVQVAVTRPAKHSITGCQFTITNVIDKITKKITLNFDSTNTKVFEIDQLTPMRFYDVSVVFTTKLGISQATQLESFWTAPSSPPQNIQLTDSRYNEMTFSWNAPAFIAKKVSSGSSSSADSVDLTYDIQISGADGLKLNRQTTTTSLTLSNLRDATIYDISITAVTGSTKVGKKTLAGVSRSLPCTGRLATAPLAPVLETRPGETGVHSTKVYWKNPARLAPGATVENYVLRYRLLGTDDSKTAKIDTLRETGKVTEFRVSDLAMSQLYSFQVQIVTSLGSSDFSAGYLIKTLYNKTNLDLLREEFGAGTNSLKKDFGTAVGGLRGEISTVSDSVNSLNSAVNQVKQDLVAVGGRVQKTEMRSAMCAYQGYLPVSNSERDITYDSVEIEIDTIGSTMDINTGKYTAGASGIYLISFTGSADLEEDDRKSFYLNMHTTSGKYDSQKRLAFSAAEDSYDNMASSRYIKLAKNEKFVLATSPQKSNSGAQIYYVHVCVSLYTLE